VAQDRTTGLFQFLATAAVFVLSAVDVPHTSGLPFSTRVTDWNSAAGSDIHQAKCGRGFLAITGLAFATLTGLEASRPFLGTRHITVRLNNSWK
jgi:hypothetical protein